MCSRLGKYLQDDYTSNNERQPDNSGSIERLPKNEPGNKCNEHNTDAGPDSVRNPYRHRAQGQRQEEKSNGVTRYY